MRNPELSQNFVCDISAITSAPSPFIASHNRTHAGSALEMSISSNRTTILGAGFVDESWRAAACSSTGRGTELDSLLPVSRCVEADSFAARPWGTVTASPPAKEQSRDQKPGEFRDTSLRSRLACQPDLIIAP